MRIVGTLMVRDEVDIVAAMVEHHLDQGIDLLIVTDNGSTDGTAEVLREYAALGAVELFHDPVHRKQQGETVTRMARRAAAVHRADWVVNADADEFFVPVDRSSTLAACLERVPPEVGAFHVPVVNLVGPPGETGSGVDRLLWRDLRDEQRLRRVGLHAQPTPDAVHRGTEDITVSQGNHFVSIPCAGAPPAGAEIEVLHLPWRSWAQFERKVVHAGRGYEANPDLRPSRNHHGMWDYRRHRAGRLREAFLLRQPTDAELHATGAPFRHDPWLRDHLRDLATRARAAHLLEPLVHEVGHRVDTDEHLRASELGRLFLDLEDELRQEQRRGDDAERRARRANARARRLRARVQELEAMAPPPTPAPLQKRWAAAVRSMREARRRPGSDGDGNRS